MERTQRAQSEPLGPPDPHERQVRESRQKVELSGDILRARVFVSVADCTVSKLAACATHTLGPDERHADEFHIPRELSASVALKFLTNLPVDLCALHPPVHPFADSFIRSFARASVCSVLLYSNVANRMGGRQTVEARERRREEPPEHARPAHVCRLQTAARRATSKPARPPEPPHPPAAPNAAQRTEAPLRTRNWLSSARANQLVR